MEVDLQALINEAKHIVFMTGAGVSTASGIPDYRSKNGLYHNQTLRPEYLLSTDALRDEPAAMYQFIMANMFYPQAQPNVIHDKMAALTHQDKAKIITQNVDGLHLKAGAIPENVIEFHGNIYDIYAPLDNQHVDYQAYQANMLREDGALLRPNITLYGEIPFRVDEAMQWVNDADLIVIVGTSFVVYPFAGLLEYAQPNAKVVAINLERIPAPNFVKQMLGDAVNVFNELKIK
ncbi:NAD-dependent protein deacylase [Periweissella fabalis]|uniref:protein acetyllysine N-acetyltransferase n=1 Tax=Periweissella fabalis TaxID=1070421 RepID=A0A7X6N3D9_9LACO|nr:NAD-dependent protein deacylase [Periweissella fabalis]MCM0599589.1 NAD-dependent protein deacylase [Periweissella fabalis]NKZ23894.1 NAD-dependent protein deacylase [Periweissella fabalis]